MPTAVTPDLAAHFAIASSLWRECHDRAACEPSLDLSQTYRGMDELMRVVMKVAHTFEAWACDHVEFEQLTEVWPYLLEDRFGAECLSILRPENLADFDEHDCRRIAARLGLTLVASR